MFGDVWRWAGAYRLAQRNIGVEARMIPESIGQLIGDARYWVDKGVYAVDECCVRFHHRLVAIHPFPNGNGRHARWPQTSCPSVSEVSRWVGDVASRSTPWRCGPSTLRLFALPIAASSRT